MVKTLWTIRNYQCQFGHGVFHKSTFRIEIILQNAIQTKLQTDFQMKYLKGCVMLWWTSLDYIVHWTWSLWCFWYYLLMINLCQLARGSHLSPVPDPFLLSISVVDLLLQIEAIICLMSANSKCSISSAFFVDDKSLYYVCSLPRDKM